MGKDGKYVSHFSSPLKAPLAGNHDATEPQLGSRACHYHAVAPRGMEAAGRTLQILRQTKLEPNCLVWGASRYSRRRAGGTCPLPAPVPSSHGPPKSHAPSLLASYCGQEAPGLLTLKGKWLPPQTGILWGFSLSRKKGNTDLFFFPVVVDGYLTFTQIEEQVNNFFLTRKFLLLSGCVCRSQQFQIHQRIQMCTSFPLTHKILHFAVGGKRKKKAKKRGTCLSSWYHTP